MAQNSFMIFIDGGDAIEFVKSSESDGAARWVDIGTEVTLFLGYTLEDEVSNAERLMAALMEFRNDAYRRLTKTECICLDPICPKEHPADRLDAIDQAKRQREIEEQARKLEAAARIAEQMDEAEYDREGDPTFNGSFR